MESEEMIEMRTIGKGVLALAVAAFFGIAAMPAVAKPVWQVCTNLEVKIGSYEDAKCSRAKTEGEYEWLEVPGTESITLKGSLRLTDTKVPIVGKVVIECSIEEIGSAGPEEYSRVNEVKMSAAQCRNIENCEEVKKGETVDLPWQTEMYETESKNLQKLLNTGSGEPGWNIECKVLGIAKQDKCVQEAGKPEILENIDTESVVLSTFQHSRKLKCEVGGAESGEWKGILKIEGNGGKGLKVANPNFEITSSKGSDILKEGEPVTFTIKNTSKINLLKPEKIIGMKDNFIPPTEEEVEKCEKEKYEPNVTTCTLAAKYPKNGMKGGIVIWVISPKEVKAIGDALGLP